MRRRIAVLVATVTALVAGGLSSTASAALPAPVVAAAITGVVAVGTGTCNAGEIPATFQSVTIEGAFVDDVNGNAYAGSVNPGNVVACIPTGSPNVVVAGIPVVVTNGYLQASAATFTASPGLLTGTCLKAQLGSATTTGGSFIQAGAEAVALVNLHFGVGASCATANAADSSPTTVAVMQVIPTPVPLGVNPPPTCSPICDEVAGPVVGV